ncbi:MAG: response regulator [Bradymonadales bacterium]|nr:response regulator [Bradymonadales bacterium]
MAKILIVDDEAPIRQMLKRLVERNGHLGVLASNVNEALVRLQDEEFELALCDVNMPGDSGLELIRTIGKRYPDMATVMVTGVDDPSIANAALTLGAYGYIIKPFELNEILINIDNALRRRKLEMENRQHREKLEQLVAERTQDLQEAIRKLQRADAEIRYTREEVIRRLAKAAEFRDIETADHIERMSRYCELLAKRLGLDADQVELIRTASPMHDVGKIGTPDRILLKPGKLTPEEFDIMKQHAEIGYRILSGSGVHLLETAASIALTHHEHFDGEGYPQGLKGEQIPLEGRVAAIADVFDALTRKRIYKDAFSVDRAIEIMREGRERHFDPELLDLFLGSFDEVRDIMRLYPDR